MAHMREVIPCLFLDNLGEFFVTNCDKSIKSLRYKFMVLKAYFFELRDLATLMQSDQTAFEKILSLRAVSEQNVHYQHF